MAIKYTEYNYDMVIVNMATVTIFDYVFKGETQKEALARGEAYYARELAEVLSLYERFQSDYWQKRVCDITTQVESGCRVMTRDEFQKAQREHFLSRELEEISLEAYDDALNALPPVFWTRHGGVELFCFREFYRDTYTYQYAKDLASGKCYKKLVDARDKSTWIPEYLKKAS